MVSDEDSLKRIYLSNNCISREKKKDIVCRIDLINNHWTVR